MKIFKLKYFLIALMATSLLSCVKDDIIKEADKEAVTESSAFVFEEGINNYIINGKLSYDRKEIAKAAKNAWNIHYDYPHNKVVISTNPSEFEKYKKNDIEFARRFDEGNESNDKSTNSARIAATYVPNHDDRLVFYYDVGGNFPEMFNFHVTQVNDTDLYVNNIFHLKELSTNYNFTSGIPVRMFQTVTTTSTVYKLYLKNNNHLSSKTLTLYRYKNLSTAAATRSFTVAKNAGLRMYAYDFRFSDGVYAKSYK